MIAEDFVTTGKATPTPEVLHQLLRYDPETGRLFWRARGPEWFSDGHRTATGNAANWNSRFAEREAFTARHRCGYRMGTLGYRSFLAHRVIWAMQTGEWPVNCVDHVDCDASNNEWRNLRLATKAENSHNRGAQANNTSGMKGVSWSKRDSKWDARIMLNGKQRCLGLFTEKADAAVAYAKASAELHGEFGRLS
jgi:hypothetical protein